MKPGQDKAGIALVATFVVLVAIYVVMNVL